MGLDSDNIAGQPPISEGFGRLTLLGTGTSEGIPRISCLTQRDARSECGVCWSARHVPGSKNRRRNTGAVIQVPRPDGGREWAVGIDCGKMWWESAIVAFPIAGLRRLDALMLTHWHADAMLGLDDLRDFTSNIDDKGDGFDCLTVFCNSVTLHDHVSRVFPYLVKSPEEVRQAKQTGGGVAEVVFDTFVDGTAFEPVSGLWTTPFNVEHGGCKDFSAFRTGSLAYISDVSGFPEGSRRFLKGANQIVLDSLQPEGTHPSHFTVEQALREIRSGFGIGLVPEAVWLVGMNHSIDHDGLNEFLQSQELPCPVRCAYDTQQIDFRIYDHREEVMR
eukprot:TRINITY_DN2349_c0_g3_i1.p1 TRINITY_DN2349_c0_g3~~TRINITY_DN2349_c0_g3_i1.p1  ORF type:complete len:333 (-),score=45.51 TRINITY_DN2349_c0_g3_i1:72-1070(-)